MGKLYPLVRQILGPSGTILPIGDPGFGKPDASTFTTYGAIQATFTWSEPWRAFDGHDGLGDSSTFPYKFQGVAPVIEFNGTDEESLSTNLLVTGFPFSMGCWFKQGALERTIMGIGDANGAPRFDLNAKPATFPYATANDGGGNAFLSGPVASSDTWHYLILVATSATSRTLYSGTSSSTTASSVSFAAGLDQTAIGNRGDQGAGYFDGLMAGGPLGPFFTHKELSADDVKQLYNLGRAALWL